MFPSPEVCSKLAGYAIHFCPKGGAMKIRKKVFDFEYEEVLDARTRELIRVGCAVAVGCPA